MRALRNERATVKELKKEVSKHNNEFDYFRVALVLESMRQHMLRRPIKRI